MNERIERVNALVSGLRLASVDLERLYAKKNQLSPLESVEVFLSEQQRQRTEKQTIIRRKRANLPAEKTLENLRFWISTQRVQRADDTAIRHDLGGAGL